MSQQEDLERSLMSACGSRVVRHLKKHGTVTKAEVAELIGGMAAGPFWSRHKVKVQDGGKAAGRVIDFLLDQQYIESAGGGKYRLKKVNPSVKEQRYHVNSRKSGARKSFSFF